MPKICVVMPAYNAEKYISEAIDSILNQTFSDFEFIIIDDGSTDNTVDIIRSYDDPRIRFVQNEHNLGVAATLNRGLELAAGEYIARMDADDISLPERFEKQQLYMETHPEVAVLGTGIEKFGIEHGTVLFNQDCEDLKIDLLFGCCFAHPTVMLRTSLLQAEALRYDPDFNRMEDYDLWDRISVHHSIAALPDILLKYRTHPSQVTHRKSKEDIRQIRAIKKRQIARLEIEADTESCESFFQYCDGSFTASKANILLLNRFFKIIKQHNNETKIYDDERLSGYLNNVSASLLNKLPLGEAASLSHSCGISRLQYTAGRLARGSISRIGGAIRQKRKQSKLKSKNFSIISNNCWGGFIYQEFGLKYNTPTIGLYFLGGDFVKFAKNPEYYLSQELIFIPWEESSYYDNLKDKSPYPVAKLADIEVYFMHYHSEEEAREKWTRRKQRINFDKLLFKLSEREGCTKEDIEHFVALPLKNKICFSYDKVDGAVYVPELKGFEGDEMPVVDSYYDKIKLLNSIR